MKINWKSVRSHAISIVITTAVFFAVLEVSRNSHKSTVKESVSKVDTVATILKDTTVTDTAKDPTKSAAVKK